MSLGIVVLVDPAGHAAQQVFRSGAIPLDRGWFRFAHWFIICMGYVVGVGGNVRLIKPGE